MNKKKADERCQRYSNRIPCCFQPRTTLVTNSISALLRCHYAQSRLRTACKGCTVECTVIQKQPVLCQKYTKVKPQKEAFFPLISFQGSSIRSQAFRCALFRQSAVTGSMCVGSEAIVQGQKNVVKEGGE